MYTIPFANGPKRYEARVDFTFGEVHIAFHRKSDDMYLFGLCGNPKSSWQRILGTEDFVPLGVMRRAISIFDEELAKARAGLTNKVRA